MAVARVWDKFDVKWTYQKLVRRKAGIRIGRHS